MSMNKNSEQLLRDPWMSLPSDADSVSQWNEAISRSRTRIAERFFHLKEGAVNMPEVQHPEITICANIQKLTAQLNGELEAAHELGLKVSISSRGLFAAVDASEQVTVRVWRETELLKEPSSELDHMKSTSTPMVMYDKTIFK